MIMDEVKRAQALDLLRHGKRADGREPFDYREVTVKKGLLPNAEGSALATIGGTKVLAGVKFDLVTPYADRPDEGTFTVNAEFTLGAHPKFEPGPPGEEAVELARVVDRGIRSAECVDVHKLFLEEGKAYGLYVDVYVLDHLGNLIDTAALAAMAALMDTKVPVVEDKAIVREKFSGPLDLSRRVVACSFEKVGGQLLLDATEEEEIASDGRMTLATAEGDLIVAAQKSGRAGFTPEEYDRLLDLALEKGKLLMDRL
jgi:exosome complex component RRP42